MELKQLNKFTQEYKLEKNDKLYKYLVILGIGVVKQELNDIILVRLTVCINEIIQMQKENKTPQGSAVPNHLRKVQSKIKEQIQQDKEQYRLNHIQKETESTINIANSSLNPFNNTPQNKLIQPCQSTHFGSGYESSAKQHKNQPQDSNANIERKLFNIDQIASSFLNSPFLKSQVKQSLFSKQELSSQQSASSNLSLFNPNNELKNFFQQLDKQMGNSISFQF